MKKRIISISLILMLVLSGTTVVFADDEIDFSQWDSTRNPGAHLPTNPHPADVVGTRLILPVSSLIEMGIITGDADGLFHPERTITRAEFAAMMARTVKALDLIAATRDEHVFNDIDGFGWATEYINTATNAGIFTGRGDGVFAPGDQVTYAEVITALIRLNPGASQAAQAMGDIWPNNYILFAQIHNMVGDMAISDWNAPATRGDTAWLLFRVVPREADDVTTISSVTVNGRAVNLIGRSLTAQIGPAESVEIAVHAIQGGNRIQLYDQASGELLAEGIGVVIYRLTDITTPHAIRITVITGTGATVVPITYTLRLTN